MAKNELKLGRVEELRVGRKDEVQGNSLGHVTQEDFYIFHMPHKPRADKAVKRGSYKAKRELQLV